MPQFDLVDETFLAVSPALVAAAIGDPGRWRVWWPDLTLSVFQDRGAAGVRWNVRGALTGSMEVWLEPTGDGVILHYYLRCDPVADGRRRSRVAAREARRRQHRAKQVFWGLKDELEGNRRPGEPAVPGADTDTRTDTDTGTDPDTRTDPDPVPAKAAPAAALPSENGPAVVAGGGAVGAKPAVGEPARR